MSAWMSTGGTCFYDELNKQVVVKFYQHTFTFDINTDWESLFAKMRPIVGDAEGLVRNFLSMMKEDHDEIHKIYWDERFREAVGC